MYSLLNPCGFITFVSVLPSSCSRGLGNLRRYRWGEMAKTHHPPKIPCGEKPAQSEGVIKGRARTRRQAPMGSAEKGVRMEMLLLRWRWRPSLEPELCLGKAAPGSLCSVQSTTLLNTRCSGAFFWGWGVHRSAHFIQLSGFVRNGVPVGCFRLGCPRLFLGSKQYLRPQYLTHKGAQVRAPFVWANEKGRKRTATEINFQKMRLPFHASLPLNMLTIQCISVTVSSLNVEVKRGNN